MMVDRETELRELRALAGNQGPTLALLYGRRRLGKTFLLGHAWPDRRRFYFLAADLTPDRNRTLLLDELGRWSGRALPPEDFPNWRTVFRLLGTLAAEGPLIVILDEVQYLLGGEDDLPSQLVAVWDRELGEARLTLVLCGSEISTLEALGGGRSPLYGRFAWAHRLLPSDYQDAGRMVSDWPPMDRAFAYGIFGGTPRYLDAAASSRRPLAEAVQETILSPRGEVHLQLATLVQQERGLRDIGDYQAVLDAVAAGHTTTDRIAQAAGFEGRDHVVRRALEVLEGLQLVKRDRNFRASRRSPWRNRIADPALRFWYRFVQRNRSLLEQGFVRRTWEERVAPHLDGYMGKVFEGMAREAFVRRVDALGLSPPVEWARWEGRDRNRRSIEVDIVAELADGRLLTGEVKWSSRPVDRDLHLALVRDLEDLAASGQGWADEALSEGSAGHLYVSAAGFRKDFRRWAASRGRDGRIHLLDLDDLYAAAEHDGRS